MENISVPGDAGLTELAGELAARLTDRGWKIAAAESCTGGWIAKCCTDLAGSSAWFDRGFVTYSNKAKTELLDVDAAVLEENGAVSREVARQMADGARRAAGVEIAVAVTGIAGPEGGTDCKPVGTVCFAWSGDGWTDDERIRFDGDRDAVRRQTVSHALQGLLDRLAA
jgi:nicotinamide-nucleotide amidase